MLKLHLILLLFWIAPCLYAQLPTAHFTTPTSACIDESLQVDNNSTNANHFQWDFCSNDFNSLQSVTTPVSVTGLVNGFGYRLIEDNGEWFGFAVSQSGPKIFRLDFGNSPLNTPSVTDLGNPGNTLLFPHDIEIYKNNGQWYGFVGSHDNNYGIIRLDFGSSLKALPSAQNIGNFGVPGRFWDLNIVKQGSDLVLVALERNNAIIVRVNFRDSFDNVIDQSLHVFKTTPVTGANLAPGIELLKYNDEWIALITSYLTNSVIQVTFGNNLFNDHAIEATYSFTGLNRPYRIRLVQEADRFVGVVSNESVAIQTIDFKKLDPSDPPEVISYSSLPLLLGVEIYRYKGKTVVQGVGTSGNKLSQIIFEEDCNASITFSTDDIPSIKYENSGEKKISLTATSTSSHNYATATRSIAISTQSSPTVDFSAEGMCANHDIFFKLNNATEVAAAQWNFGDFTPVDTDKEPIHEFVSTGEFAVSLIGQAHNGCGIYARKRIKVYPEPHSNFLLPADPICTNNELIFKHAVLNAGLYDGNLEYDWSINGTTVSQEDNLHYTFLEEGDHNLTLNVSIPGCSDSKTLLVENVKEGPEIGFSIVGNCEGEAIYFTNESAGAIAGFEWNLGGFLQTEEASPSYTFNAGRYDILLDAIGENGCTSRLIKEVVVNSKPIADFRVANPVNCTNTPLFFEDLTSPPDTPLATWLWQFPEGKQSQEQHPVYSILLHGEYLVGLTVTAESGCSNYIEKTITVKPSPDSVFTTSATCKNLPANFSGPSQEDIIAWQWLIDDKSYSGQNPVHTFRNPGTYNAELLVKSSNGCEGRFSEEIIVPELLSPMFNIEKNCLGETALLTDITPDDHDPVESRVWLIEDLFQLEGEQAQFAFRDLGEYELLFTVTGESGCTYTTKQPIRVVPHPQASFTVSTATGAPPLPVDFNNGSTNATNYLWDFGDGVISDEVAPDHTFMNIGEFAVKLIASIPEGCTSTVEKVIRLSPPHPDVNIIAITTSENADKSLKVVITLQNDGNTILKNLPVDVDISGNTLIREVIDGPVYPNARYNLTLGYGLPKVSQLEFLCASTILDDDQNPTENRECVEFQKQLRFLPAYPNPVRDHFSVEWLAVDNNAPVTVSLYSLTGTRLFTFTTESVKGLNQKVLGAGNVEKGIYMLVLETSGTKAVQRILISR